jgi:putative toxin-antitoxin system antitoxin component (TIGR02293 family)
MARAIRNVERLLGGRSVIGRPIRDELDLAAAVREGFPVAVVFQVAGRGKSFTLDEIYRLVIPRRTLEHRQGKHDRLTPNQSDRIARLARLTALAEETFGSVAKAQTWLRRPTRPLAGKPPIELLDSDAGTKAVEDLLGRIEHGIAA